MRSPEEGLARALQLLVPEPPQPISFEDLARRRRRRTASMLALPTAAVAVATAVVIPLFVAGRSGDNTPPSGSPSPSHSGVMPWVDRPASLPPPPSSPAPLPAQYAPCTGAQISAHTAGSGAAAGNLATRLRLVNTSGNPCTLAGYPTTFVGVRKDGGRNTLHPSHGTFFDGSGYWPANLRPGQAAELVIGTADACPALNQPTPQPDPYVGETIGLPAGGEVSASAPFDPSCGLGVSKMGAPAPPPPEPDAYPGLALSIDRPDTAPAGTTMHFTITLTNVTNAPVQLTPCPVYSEGLYIGGAHAYVYTLNCDQVRTIEAGQAVTYAMQIPVPSRTGIAKFGWGLPAGSQFEGGVLTIT